MSQCVLVLCLLLHVHLTTAAQGARSSSSKDGVEGCRVDDGHAVCESENLAASIKALPACTTNITFSLLPGHRPAGDRFNWFKLKEANFSHLENLQELLLYTKRANHSHVRLSVHDYAAIQSLNNNPAFKVLRLQLVFSIISELNDANLNMYDNLRSLEVLDLTRTQLLGLSAAKHMISNQSSVKILILKNIQAIYRAEMYNPLLDLGHFICNSNVQYLDLSYNDISSIMLMAGDCNSRLQYINLDHNIIAYTKAVDSSNKWYIPRLLSLLSMASSVRAVSVSWTWQSEKYQEGLWQDTQSYNIEGLTEIDFQQSYITQLLQGSSLGFLARYDFWIEDIMKHCGDFGYFDILRCHTHIEEDLCVFFQCLFPDFDTSSCANKELDINDKLQIFANQMCSYYKQCAFSVPLPLPPHLHSVFMHDFGKYMRMVGSYPTSNITTFCLHPANNVEHIDISNSDFAYIWSDPGSSYCSGLERLKYLNLQGCQLPLHRLKLLFSDQRSMVTELHIGGNIVRPDGMLPADMLQVHPKLSVLNLSNANLHSVENGAFGNLTQLSVLDLSQNRLNSSALSTLDLSKTRLQSLNLTDNVLTYIPSPFRSQLDKMNHLDLYLSGNSFMCSCDNLEFLQWVQSNSSSITFHYAGDHLCADSPGNTIHNIDVDALHCDWYWVQPVIAVSSSLALTALLLVLFGMYKKRWTIRNLIFRLQERLCSPSEDTATTQYKYDAFVLYSSIPDDRLWVHFKLVQELENVYGFRLCIHHRDFLAGCDIVDNIEKAIPSSRKVLVVMSENFLRSEWCVEEVHMTSSVDRNKFIVIMYRDVMLSAAPMPAVVRRLLESRVFIEWDEIPEAQQLFWKKLRRALYSKHMRSPVGLGDAGSLEMNAPVLQNRQ